MRAGLLIRIIYALCLLGATANHVRAVHSRGWMPPDLPWLTAAYWSSLTVLDPLAAVLLFVRPKIGIAATAAIILSDVIHNLWFRAGHPVTGSLYQDVTSSPFMMSQITFLLVVAVTAPIAWKECSRPVPRTGQTR
jgi:hypothetical protein